MKALYWIPAGAIILAGAAAVVVRKQAPRKVPPSAVHGMRVPLSLSQSNGSWQVDWDHYAPLVQTASYGTLLIRETGRSAQVRLSPAQLKDGNVVYVGLTEPVHFDLEVYGASPAAALPPALPAPAAAEPSAPPRQEQPLARAARHKRVRPRAAKPRTTARSRRSHRRRR